MGKKQDLQKAEKELEVLVKHTNTKIVATMGGKGVIYNNGEVIEKDT